MPDKNYLTIAREAMDEFVEKRSRFMGFIKPVTTEEEALTFIREKQTGTASPNWVSVTVAPSSAKKAGIQPY